MRCKPLLIFIGFLLFFNGCSIAIGTNNLTIETLEKPVAMIDAVPADTVDFWTAMRHFDFDYARRHAVGEAYQRFADGLELIMDGQLAAAETLYTTLFETVDDSLFRENTAEVLQSLWTHQNKWECLIALDAQLPHGLGEDNTVIMAAAYAGASPEVFHFPAQTVILPAKLSISGVPMIEVTVNGLKRKFWIDTGAEMTVLASDFAKECDVTAIGSQHAKVGTSTYIKVKMWPGVIKELKIGALTITNHPVIILDQKDLEFKLFGFIRLLKVDGILGWNAIENLYLAIDYKNLQTTIRQPIKHQSGIRNFHYLGQPLVSLSDTLGTPLHFFLDVGANRTGLYEPALTKVDISQARVKNAIVGGAGGTQRMKTTAIPAVALVLGNHRLNFKNLNAHGDGLEGYFYCDGVLGSDIAKQGTLIIDFQNGRCDLEIPSEK